MYRSIVDFFDNSPGNKVNKVLYLMRCEVYSESIQLYLKNRLSGLDIIF